MSHSTTRLPTLQEIADMPSTKAQAARAKLIEHAEAMAKDRAAAAWAARKAAANRERGA